MVPTSPLLTLLVPTFNESDCLERCLQSAVGLADEVLVVDSFSTDDTLEIARKYGARIVQREYENSASQKNWAIPQATHPWILLLDADEWLSPALYAEIEAWKKHPNPSVHGYWMYRANHFMGRRIRFSGWQNDRVIRLFQRDLCAYEPKHVHAEIAPKGPVDVFSGKLFHNTYKGLDHHREKLDRYAAWQAQDYHARTGAITIYHTLCKPAYRFFRQYVLQGGILDGFPGFVIARFGAYAVKARYRELARWRKANNVPSRT